MTICPRKLVAAAGSSEPIYCTTYTRLKHRVYDRFPYKDGLRRAKDGGSLDDCIAFVHLAPSVMAEIVPAGLNGLFFTCQSTPASCASKEIASMLQRCGRYDLMGFTETDLSACCDSNFAQNGKVRECVYYHSSNWSVKRISIFPEPNNPTKPKYLVRNWDVYHSIEHIDIARVSVQAVDQASFDYATVKKLSIVDSDLESIQTPPVANLNVIDLSNNKLKTFPIYLFNANQTTIDQLNIYGNPWTAAITVDAAQCTRLKTAAETGHITGIPVACTCDANSAKCSLPTTAPSTTATVSTTVSPTTAAATTTQKPSTSLASPSPTGEVPLPLNSSTGTAAPIVQAPTSAPTTTSSSAGQADPSAKTSSGSTPGTVLVAVMIVAVLGLAIVAFIMYRRRRGSPRTPAQFELSGGSSSSVPVLTSDNKTQLMRKTSSSASMILKTTPLRNRGEGLPMLSVDTVKLIHVLSGNLFSGKLNGEHVVMKRLDAREVNKTDVTKFIADVNVLGRLDHPNLVMLYGIVRFGDYEVAAVAEYMHGGSLSHVLLKDRIKLSWTDKLRMAFEVASALAYVHSQPTCTRTKCLTSRDVLVNSSLTCKLNVFDFMKSYEQSQDAEWTFGGGSMAWEAPEVLSHNCSRSSTAEIYALGVILGEIVTRTRPFQSWIHEYGYVATDVRILERNAARMRDVPHENRPEYDACPHFYKHIVASCLSRDVLQRPLAVSVAETLWQELTLLLNES
ncbi:hypothetical protein AeRB84_004477 [Aphanomyces euteiches]|nr:hypothetical protein AeRB84_004477 [Aphanomyces euteiches]